MFDLHQIIKLDRRLRPKSGLFFVRVQSCLLFGAPFNNLGPHFLHKLALYGGEHSTAVLIYVIWLLEQLLALYQLLSLQLCFW